MLLFVALAPAVALAVDPGGWYPFGPSKWLVVSVLVPAGVALFVATRPVRVAARGATLAAAALVGWMAVAAVFGIDPLYAWIGTPERHFGALMWLLLLGLFVVGQSLDVSTDGPKLAIGLAGAGFAVGLLATAEALGWEPSVLDVDSRLSGTFGSPAYLGAATALLLPACVGVAADGSLGRWLRVVAAAALPLLGVAGIGSGARAAWVGLGAAAVVVAWLHRRAPTGRTVLFGGAAVVVVAAGLVVFSPVGSRLASTFDRDAPGGEGRLDEWRVATRVVADHPLVGVGPDGYRIAFAEGVDAEYEREHGRDPLPDRAHSGPLDVALAGGLPALVAWLAFVVLVGRSVMGRLRGRPLVAGLAAALIAHFVGQLLLFPTFELEPIAWLLAGLLVGTVDHSRRPRGRISSVGASSIGVIAAIALVAGGLDIAADHRAGRGDGEGAADLRPDVLRYHLLEAKQLVSGDRGTLSAIRAIDDGLDVSPDVPIALLRRAELLVERARNTQVPAHIEEARAETQRLLDRDPNNAALLLQSGTAAQLAGDVEAAEAAWTKATDLAPDSAAPLINLALLHLEAGDRAAALRDLERAEAADPDDPRIDDVRGLLN